MTITTSKVIAATANRKAADCDTHIPRSGPLFFGPGSPCRMCSSAALTTDCSDCSIELDSLDVPAKETGSDSFDRSADNSAGGVTSDSSTTLPVESRRNLSLPLLVESRRNLWPPLPIESRRSLSTAPATRPRQHLSTAPPLPPRLKSFGDSADDVTLTSFGSVGLLAAMAAVASLAKAGAEPVCERWTNSRQLDRSSTSRAAEGSTPPRIKASTLEPLLRSRWSIQLISVGGSRRHSAWACVGARCLSPPNIVKRSFMF